VHHTEAAVAAVLLQLIVIVLAARLAGNAAVALRQPRAVGEIVAGLMLGPSLFGALAPELSKALFVADAAAPMLVLSQIGLLLLMFQIGCEFEFSRLAKPSSQRAVVTVAAFSVGAPLLAGFAMGWLSWEILAPAIDRTAFSLFVSIALAITALPILGRILREYRMTRTETGVIAISAAAANDVVGWVLLAAIAAFVSADAQGLSTPQRLLAIAALLALFWFVVRPVARLLINRFPISNGELPSGLLAIVLAMIFAAGVATQGIDIFTIFGGFLLGLVFHVHHDFVEAWRRQIGQFVLIFFLPIFFTYTGLRTNVLGLDSIKDWAWCAGFLAVSVAAKIIPVYLAARLSGLDKHNSAMLGVLMNTRALMELIVLNIGLNRGFIPQDVFTMLVIMAISTTMMTGPLLQALLKRVGAPVTERVDA
jgi:Kef-type K+ transport system membrane component KefB